MLFADAEPPAILIHMPSVVPTEPVMLNAPLGPQDRRTEAENNGPGPEALGIAGTRWKVQKGSSC